MGCHTWFYKKINISHEEAKELAIKNIKSTIRSNWRNCLGKGSKKELDDFFEYYPEYKKSYSAYRRDITKSIKKLKQLIESIRKGGATIKMWDWVICDPCTQAYFDKKNKNFYVENKGYWDIIRVYGYPEEMFFDLNSLMEFIDNNPDSEKYTQEQYEKMKKYWELYPESMVRFG